VELFEQGTVVAKELEELAGKEVEDRKEGRSLERGSDGKSACTAGGTGGGYKRPLKDTSKGGQKSNRK